MPQSQPRPTQAIIDTEALTKRYEGFPALDRVSLRLPHGSIGLLGENGAGKTTFLKLILGLIRPTSGSARVLGFDVAGEGLELRRRVGYMPEDECLPPDLSAHDLVTRMGQLSGLPQEVARQRSYDVLHLVGLGEERYRPIGGYSVGMRQRVKLAQALVHDPELVLLDEPTSGLDPQGRSEMLALIRDIHGKIGLNLLVSTHLLPDVERVCDHAVILRAGRAVAQGRLQDLLGTVREGLLVRVVGDRRAFIEGLRAKGLDAVETAPTVIRVRTDHGDPYREILSEAVATGVQLRRLERQTRTLEDVFVSLHQREAEHE